MSNIVKIIDYGFGNLASVKNAIIFNGFKAELCSNPNDIKNTSHLILPGVGSFESGISKLKNDGWDKSIKSFLSQNGYLLGICLGMQLLFKFGTNEATGEIIKGLNLIDGSCEKFNLKKLYKLPLPHIGFNAVNHSDSKIWRNIKKNSSFYFVHSYRVKTINQNKKYLLSYSNYGEDFISFIENDRIFGAQFHPEKSHNCGLQLLNNFCSLK